MTEDKHQELLDLLPAYALNSLDPYEAESVKKHLPRCEICQAELAAYQSVVDLLPLAAPEVEPDPALKGRLLSGIEASKPLESTDAADPVPDIAMGWWQRFNHSVQAWLQAPRWQPVAILFLAILVISNVLIWQLVDNSGGGGDSWRRVRLTGSEIAPEAAGIIYISADGRSGTIIVDKLPQLDPEQQYQLWLIEDGQRTSGAVFSVDDHGYRGIGALWRWDCGSDAGTSVRRLESHRNAAGDPPHPPFDRYSKGETGTDR